MTTQDIDPVDEMSTRPNQPNKLNIYCLNSHNNCASPDQCYCTCHKHARTNLRDNKGLWQAAMAIVNPILDLAGTDVKTRQSINDQCDDIVMVALNQRCIQERLDELYNLNTRRHYGKDYQDSLDELDEYKDARIATLESHLQQPEGGQS